MILQWKDLITYRMLVGSKGKAIVGTVSGTDITFGTAGIFKKSIIQIVYVPKSRNAC